MALNLNSRLNPNSPFGFISFAIEFQYFPLRACLISHRICAYPYVIHHYYRISQLLLSLPNPIPQFAFEMKGGKSKAESKRAEPKLAVNKKGAAATKGGKKPAKGKAAKDPNKPKRPPSAFFVFMEDFRKQFKKDNPDNKAVSAVGKAAGAKWKTMSDAEKAPYAAKSEKRKVEYEKSMRAYNTKQAEGPADGDEEESEKSVSEVNDEDDEDDASGEEDDDE